MKPVLSAVANGQKFMLLSSALLITLVFASVAQAQYDPGATMDLGAGYGQTGLSQSILSGTRNLGSKSGAGKNPTNELKFYWKDRILRQFQAETIQKIGGSQPERQQRLAALLKDLDPTPTFRSLVQRSGLNPYFIPDILTVYCATQWEIVKGRPASKAGIVRLRDQIQASILEQPSVSAKIRNFDQQTKQYWLETFAYNAILSRANYNRLLKQGKSEEIAKLRSTIVKDVKSLGVDIQTLEL
jgi:hypothetical protein